MKLRDVQLDTEFCYYRNMGVTQWLNDLLRKHPVVSRRE